ncbi:MAG TPA: hypothetical protein P5215_07220, partial [Bacteroidales bacterium]|nr:hypothetical protein [Bacteroidales bacterium]
EGQPGVYPGEVENILREIYNLAGRGAEAEREIRIILDTTPSLKKNSEIRAYIKGEKNETNSSKFGYQ